MSKEYFADKPYAAWIKQFKTFEDGKAFRAAFASTQSVGGRRTSDRSSRTATGQGGTTGSSDSKLIANLQASNDKILAALHQQSAKGSSTDTSLAQVAAQLGTAGTTLGSRVRAFPASHLRAAERSGRSGRPRFAGRSAFRCRVACLRATSRWASIVQPAPRVAGSRMTTGSTGLLTRSSRQTVLGCATRPSLTVLGCTGTRCARSFGTSSTSTSRPTPRTCTSSIRCRPGKTPRSFEGGGRRHSITRN